MIQRNHLRTWTMAVCYAVAALALLASISSDVSAEQLKAGEYRSLIESGKLYVEYGVVMNNEDNKYAKQMNESGKEVLVINGNRRISYAKGPRSGDTLMMQKSIQDKNPLFKDWAKYWQGNGNWRPNILYEGQKYYSFFGKNDAFLVNEEDLLKLQLPIQKPELPRFFLALVPNHPELVQGGTMGANMVSVQYSSNCVESGSETFRGKMMGADKYLVQMMANGITTLSWTYTFYYDELGDLRYVTEEKHLSEAAKRSMQESHERAQERLKAREKAIEAEMGKKKFEKWKKEHAGMVGMLGEDTKPYYKIEKITGDIPKEMNGFPTGCKVYALEAGTMNDLVGGHLTVVEQH